MDEAQARRAGQEARRLADDLHAKLHPGDELRDLSGVVTSAGSGLSPDAVNEIDRAIQALGEADDALNPGLGRPDVAIGRAKLDEARGLLAPYRSNPPFMEQNLRRAIQDALGTLERL
jgi:hypothetical protein